ncbi:MAG: YiiG family protein [Myxococcota bacterium]
MTRIHFTPGRTALGLLAAGCLALVGCDKLTDAVEKGAEAVQKGAEAAGNAAAEQARPMTEDDKLGEKLSGYIECINGTSDSVHDSANRYFQWVDHEKGLTGKERYIYGTRELGDQKTCKDGAEKSAGLEPSLPDLEAAGKAYITALDATLPLVQEAYKYYDEENYKDDKFAKGLELHPKLVAAWEAFDKADLQLRTLVKEQNEALLERELVRVEKEEGRKLRFLSKNIMAHAKKLMNAAHHESWETLDLEALTKELTAFEAAIDETTKYADEHKKESGSIMMYSHFTDAATDLKKQAKALMRRKRDDKPWTKKELKDLGPFPHTVEGHPVNLSKNYNDLIKQSNGLNWMRYEPE